MKLGSTLHSKLTTIFASPLLDAKLEHNSYTDKTWGCCYPIPLIPNKSVGIIPYIHQSTDAFYHGSFDSFVDNVLIECGQCPLSAENHAESWAHCNNKKGFNGFHVFHDVWQQT